jgi:hypothetical protein
MINFENKKDFMEEFAGEKNKSPAFPSKIAIFLLASLWN